MERETGLEPATSSLGIRLSIDNKDGSVFVDLVLAIEITQFSFWTSSERLMAFKWCSSQAEGSIQIKLVRRERRFPGLMSKRGLPL